MSGIEKYLPSHLRSLRMHKLIAARLSEYPENVVAHAKANIARWSEQRGMSSYYKEWSSILEEKSIEEIRSILIAEDGEGQRLRASSPFVGILSKEERDSFFMPKFIGIRTIEGS